MNFFDKILKKLYLNNFFKTCVYLIKLISFFNKKINSKLVFYNFFKKRKKKYCKNLLLSMYQPKVFIFNLDIDTEKQIKIIKNHKNLYKENIYSDHGHKNIWQSEHDLNKKDFNKLASYLQKLINNLISSFYNFQHINIIKMWFVITKNSAFIKKHSHFESDLSAVLYIKADNEKLDADNGLKIYNPGTNLQIFKYCPIEQKFNSYFEKNDYFIFKPKTNDLIIFNSYLEHSVHNYNSKIQDRISLPFDMDFSDEK